jgi:hypothetical protein
VIAILGDRSAESLRLFRWVWIVSAGGFLISVVVALWYPGPVRTSTKRRRERIAAG